MKRSYKVLTDHAIARGMLEIGNDWHSSRAIARHLCLYREHLFGWLNKLLGSGHVERRNNPTRRGYQWRLTELGVNFATYARPDAVITARPTHDDRALINALGMNIRVEPPLGRVHLLR
jgi:DNA-binding MarR family transcriptional regulator